MSCSCAPLRPLGRGDLGVGGGGKSVANLVILTGSVVRVVGSGSDSTNVTLSSGKFDRSEAGKSAGEHATMTWRRCTLDV
jgi:hypothetical protein